MERSVRLAALRKIIETKRVGSQDELLTYLEEESFIVTQATLSRDLKHLKIGKVPNGKGGYLYAFSDTSNKAGSDKSLVEDVKRGFISLDFTGTFGVVRTLPGHASTVAFAIDNLNIEEILGTIAGDDTILILPTNGITREELLDALNSRISGFKEM